MDSALFISLLTNLMNVNVTNCDDEEACRLFEQHFCLQHSLQPMYTKDALHYFASNIAGNVFYEMGDDLGGTLIMFRFQETAYVLGPFLKTAPEEKRIQAELMKHNLSGSYLLSIKLFLSKLPILSGFHVIKIVHAVMKSAHPEIPDFSYRKLRGLKDQTESPAKIVAEQINYDAIYERYSLENRLMDLIAAGDVHAVRSAFYDMTSSKAGKAIAKGNLNIYYGTSAVAIIRVLARKAAERSGLSVVVIDEITQRSLQKITASSSQKNTLSLSAQMIVELTQAVHDYLVRKEDYSPLIGRVTEHLHLNYSQEYSLADLADRFHVSTAHLSRQFRKETGETITSYLARLRCNEAAKLLSETAMQISEIGAYVGYLDNNYFVKVFKKQYGVTPGDYRGGQK